ncbi:MAG: nicotinate (nicotinamide) nucleotide adenylyltransferase [candidate division WOR-3 bacterium]
MQKIGVFGGTFDPIHIGHIILAQDVIEHVQLDKIFFVVNYHPPHKKVYTSFEHRFNMVRLAITDHKDFVASDIEKAQNISPSYTYHSLCKLKELIPLAELYLIIGSDQYNSFQTWYKYGEILELVKLIVLKRPGYAPPKNITNNVVFIDERLIDISSTEIRERVKKGKSIKFMVPELVEEYIKKNKLYI